MDLVRSISSRWTTSEQCVWHLNKCIKKHHQDFHVDSTNEYQPSRWNSCCSSWVKCIILCPAQIHIKWKNITFLYRVKYRSFSLSSLAWTGTTWWPVGTVHYSHFCDFHYRLWLEHSLCWGHHLCCIVRQYLSSNSSWFFVPDHTHLTDINLSSPYQATRQPSCNTMSSPQSFTDLYELSLIFNFLWHLSYALCTVCPTASLRIFLLSTTPSDPSLDWTQNSKWNPD